MPEVVLRPATEADAAEMLALGLSVYYTVKYRRRLHLCKDGGRVAA